MNIRNRPVCPPISILQKPTAGNWTLPVLPANGSNDGDELKVLNQTGQAHVWQNGAQPIALPAHAEFVAVLLSYGGQWYQQQA
jgi:hypothetical protein